MGSVKKIIHIISLYFYQKSNRFLEASHVSSNCRSIA